VGYGQSVLDDRNGSNIGPRRPLPEPTAELGDSGRRSGDDDLDAPVRQISRPTVETERFSLTSCRRAIPNALNAAGDEALYRT
jgi:hypothetical protein